MTTSKYAQPLTPDSFEQAALEVFRIHQSGSKNRGDKIEEIVNAASKKREDQETIILRAQRLQLDGLPKGKPTKASKTPPEASKPSGRDTDTKNKSKRAAGVAKASPKHNGQVSKIKKPKNLPF